MIAPPAMAWPFAATTAGFSVGEAKDENSVRETAIDYDRDDISPLIRPSGTFSRWEKDRPALSLSHRERVARSAG